MVLTLSRQFVTLTGTGKAVRVFMKMDQAGADMFNADRRPDMTKLQSRLTILRRRFKSHCLVAQKHNCKTVHVRAIHERIRVNGGKAVLIFTLGPAWR